MLLDCYREYKDLREEIDTTCNQLRKLHKEEMVCKDGCDSCCRSFKILPVEYHSIKKAINNSDIEINRKAKKGECKFLVNKRCTIYSERPIICRTHGYPLVRLNEETEAYEVSFCKLNFSNFPLIKFNESNVLFEDTFNSKLYMLNKRFVKELKQENYDAIELLELNNLTT